MIQRHKRYAGVLGLAIVALLGDRLFLAPDSAGAAPPQEPAAAATQTAPGAVATIPIPAAPVASLEASIAGKLEAIAEGRSLNVARVEDVFAMPASWDEVTPENAGSVVGAFIARHQLQASLANGTESMAIVDGRTVRLGQTLDGLRLEQILPRAAIFVTDNGERAELPLQPESVR